MFFRKPIAYPTVIYAQKGLFKYIAAYDDIGYKAEDKFHDAGDGSKHCGGKQRCSQKHPTQQAL